MSTRIYNGFRCGTRDQREAMRRIDRVVPRLVAIAERREQAFVTRRAVEIVDQRCIARALGRPPRPLDPSARPWTVALTELRTRQEEVRRTDVRDPSVDVDVTLTLWKTRFNGEWLGFVGADGDEAAYRCVIGQRGFRAYAYWDNSDSRPAGVSARAWNQRRQAWAGTPRPWEDNGHTLSWTCTSTTDPDPSRAIDHLPVLAQRVRPLAENLLLNAWLMVQPPLPDDASPHEHVARYLEFRDQLDTLPDLQARLADQQAWVGAQLMGNPRSLHQALLTPVE